MSALPESPYTIRVLDANYRWNWSNLADAIDLADAHKNHTPTNAYVVVERESAKGPFWLDHTAAS